MKRVKTNLSVWALTAALLCLFAGCAETASHAFRHQYLADHPELEPRYRRLIESGRVWVGMSQAQAKAAWGVPWEINRGGGAGGAVDQWVYRDYHLGYTAYRYLYFKDGRLVRWQD